MLSRFTFKTCKSGLVLVAAASLLWGCKKTEDSPPTPSTPVTPTTTTPPQYGTPFTGVPAREDAVLYQVNMRAFSQSGDFAGIKARLDSIKALRANVLYLMPVHPVGTARGVNSPYCVQDYQAVNPEFGTLTDLRTLVDAAHSRGLSVMLDWVPNHTSYDHAWIADHPDWYLRDANGTILSPPNTNFLDVAQLDFNSAPMRLAMIAAMKWWVYTVNIDGFRCDYADSPPADFWQQATDSLRRIRTHKLLLLAEGTRSNHYLNGFDYTFGFRFYDALKRVYVNNSPAISLDALNTSEYNSATGTQQVVRYTTNHDVNGSEGVPSAIFRGNAGAMSAFVIASLYKGIPMIYNGQEAGMTVPIRFPFTAVNVVWGAHPDVTRAYQNLLTARDSSVALKRGLPISYSTTDVCAFTKTAGTEQALVLANVRNAPTQFIVPAALANSTWTDALNRGRITLGAQVSLPAYGYLVLKK